MSLQSLLNDTCTIYTKTKTVDSYGDASSTFASSATGVRCRLQGVSAFYKGIAGAARAEIGKTAKPSYKLYLEESAVVAQGNKIAVTGAGKNLLVTFAKKDSSAHHWELECEELDFIQ